MFVTFLTCTLNDIVQGSRFFKGTLPSLILLLNQLKTKIQRYTSLEFFLNYFKWIPPVWEIPEWQNLFAAK